MSVLTQQIGWGELKGYTRLELRVGSQRMTFVFRTRGEAKDFLVALRKRVR